MQGAFFEWDDHKAEINLRRHGLSFAVAALAFEDQGALEWSDLREDYGEERHELLGVVEGRVLHVAYTFRQDRIRIISARLATAAERRRYHDG
jgi:uncharacterized DUF497 family protein